MAEPQDKREQIGAAGMQAARSQQGTQGLVEISACVITKNEEKNIGRWLNCMRVAADEMIVVDTGSTDKTCELARAAGARLYHFAWRDDFAAAKNYAIEQARGRWILFLDADEYFTPATVGAVRPLLRRLTPHHEVAGVLCRLTNIDLDDGGRLSTASMQLRMFRNLRSLRYVGRIHEALDVPHNRSIELTREVEIYHTGYSHSIIKAKLQRNRAMLEKRIAERGGTIKPTERSYLMDIAYGLDDYDAAIHYARETLAQDKVSDEIKARAYETWASSCLKGPEPIASAIACLLQAEEACPQQAEFPLMLGLCYYEQGKKDLAEETLRGGLDVHAAYAERTDVTSVIDNAARLLPTVYWRLGDIAMARDDLAAAQEHYVQGLQLQKRHAGLLRSFWQLLRRLQAPPADAIALLNQFFDPEADAAWLARYLLRQHGGVVWLYYARRARQRGEMAESPLLDYLAAGRPAAAAAAAAELLQRCYALGLRAQDQGQPQPQLQALMPPDYASRWRKEQEQKTGAEIL